MIRFTLLAIPCLIFCLVLLAQDSPPPQEGSAIRTLTKTEQFEVETIIQKEIVQTRHKERIYLYIFDHSGSMTLQIDENKDKIATDIAALDGPTFKAAAVFYDGCYGTADQKVGTALYDPKTQEYVQPNQIAGRTDLREVGVDKDGRVWRDIEEWKKSSFIAPALGNADSIVEFALKTEADGWTDLYKALTGAYNMLQPHQYAVVFLYTDFRSNCGGDWETLLKKIHEQERLHKERLQVTEREYDTRFRLYAISETTDARSKLFLKEISEQLGGKLIQSQKEMDKTLSDLAEEQEKIEFHTINEREQQEMKTQQRVTQEDDEEVAEEKEEKREPALQKATAEEKKRSKQ